LNNVTSAVPKINAGQYSLAVYWKGDDDLEYFTLRCRNEEQLRMWENTLTRLIQEVAARRISSRDSQHSRIAHIPNSTSPAPQRQPNERTFSTFSQTTSYGSISSQPLQSSRSARYPSSHGDDYGYVSSQYGGPQGYPPDTGFDVDLDDEYEDYPYAGSVPPSGRGTPVGSRRLTAPEVQAYSNARGHSPLPLANSAYSSPTIPSARPSLARASGSHVSDISFGAGVPPPRGSLKSQFSSNKLRTAYNERPDRRSNGSASSATTFPSPRSRSASQPTHPSAYASREPPPPLPTSAVWSERSQENRRGSGSSQSTNPDSSDYSPHSGSPITPYGSSDSSLAGIKGSQYDNIKVVTSATAQLKLSVPVKVKVHFHEDIFVIQVPRSTEYEELVERVGKKIRLCGPRRDDGPLRVKYKDEDGDLVSLGSTEDVQMAFEAFRPGSQVTLYVQ